MKRKSWKSFCVVCLFSAAANCFGGPALAVNGKAKMTVVAAPAEINRKYLAVRPYELYKEAVNDFKTHLALATGGDFNIPPEKASGRILLGNAALTSDALKAEAAALPYGAYIIRTSGDDLLIFGGDVTGTVNGMYAFLRDELGIEFMGVNDLFRIIPEKRDIVLGDLDKTVIPAYRFRDFSGFYVPETSGYLWGMRMGNFVLTNQNNFTANHSFHRIFPASRYAKTHPEYYSMSGGKRLVPASDKDMNWQVCLSNPEVAGIVIDAAKAYFKADKKRLCFELVSNDNMSFCRCDKCRALQPVRPESDNCFTDVFLEFANHVAREVGKDFPDRYIGIIAYSGTDLPPLKKIEPNIFVVFCPDHSQYYDADYRKMEMNNLDAWRAKANVKNPFGWHAYSSLCSIAPRYYPHSFAETLKKMNLDYNVVSFLGDGCGSFWPWAGPQNYMIARLLWDVSLDPEKLLNGYFTKLYGPAAKPVREFYDLLEKRYTAPRQGGVWLKDHNTLAAFELYSVEDTVLLRKYLAEAKEAAAGKNEVLARINYLNQTLEPVLNMMEVFQLSRRNSTNPKLEEIEHCIHIMNNIEEEWNKRILNDPSLCVYSYQKVRPGFDYTEFLRKLWHMETDANIAKAIVKLWKTDKSDKLVKLRKQFETSALRQTLIGLSTGEYRVRENQLANPDFEVAGADSPDGPDWTGSGAQNWACWRTSSATQIGITDKAPYKGKKSAFIKGESGCLISAVVPLDFSDEKRIFRAEGYVRRSKENAKVTIRLIWYDKNGIMGNSQSFESPAAVKVGEWEKLEVMGEAPKGVANCAVFLFANNLNGSEVLFDEIAFRKVISRK